MLKIDNCLTTRSQITALQTVQNNIVIYSTLFHGTKVLNSDRCETDFNIANKNLNSKTTALAFSPNGKFIAFANKNIIYVLYISSHKIIKTIKTDEAITLVVFDSSSQYIFCGTKKGRVFQYRYNNSSSLSRLCSFPLQEIARDKVIKNSFVSAFATYENLVATSGYGGSIFVIDILARANRNIITNSSVRIDALCFIDRDTIVSGDVDGTIYISTFNKNKITDKIVTPFSNITQIILMPNPQYILINTQTDSLAMVDIKNYKIVSDNYLTFEVDINKIALGENGLLLVALKNLELLKIEIPTIAELKRLIDADDLDKAFNLVEHSPLLQDSKEHKELEKKYHILYQKAVEALTYNNIALAIEITSTLKNNHYKQENIEALFKSFEHFSKFNILFLEKRYPLAYAMCSKYPAFTHTPQYKKMELLWKETFSNAQRQMLLKRDDLAIAILQEHMTTSSKKPLIKFILNHTDQFLQFLKAIQKRDFSTINLILSKNKIFSNIPNFISLMNEIETNILKVERYILKGMITLAKNLIKELVDIPQIEHRIKFLLYKNTKMELLQKAYIRNDFPLCYETLDNHPCLTTTELGSRLERDWSKMIKICENYALQGDIKNIKLTLGKLLLLSTRREKIGDLLRVSYHVKIKFLISRKSFKKAELIINSYIEIFGMDNELKLISKNFEHFSSIKISILENHTQKLPRDSWLKSEFLLNMVE
ncbi:MAG: hypothetical protein U9P38_02490 [Campylobacterota bacterium]|nr:hypothetical protein [Campylobacterota bacterium]